MDDKLTLFYNSLTANPAITGLPEDIGTFKTALSDPARSEVFYNSLKANPNIKGLPDNYKDFLSGLSIKAGGVTPQQPKQPFLEGLGRKGGVSALSLGEMVTEIPQAVEAVANIPMNIFAGAMIKKAERKGELDKETADFLREEQLYPKANFGQILPSAPGQESMGQALADSKLNEWFESNAEKLNETVTRYDQTATQYLKNKQFGNALGAISYGVAESIAPTLAAMLVPGGAAALGLGVGAQKYDEVKDREDMSEAMKLADSATSGIFEWLFEKFGSKEMAKYLKSYYNKVGGKGLQQAFGSQTMQNLIGKAYKKLGLWFAPVHEGVSEFATQIGQDLASKLSGESPDLTFQDIKANAIEAFLIGTGMGGFFSSTTALAKKVKDTVSPPSPLDTGTEPGAIGPLQVPRTQQEVEQIINEYGRNIKFGETPLEEDPDPMVSFAQTKLGQKVVLKQEAGLSGDKFFIAIDTETKQPLFIKPADIVERKDVPYQQWFNDEMNNYLIVKDEADNVTAQIEAPVKEGQDITLKDRNFFVSQVTAGGVTLNEIDEKGNITEGELIVPPEDYGKVFGVPAVDNGGVSQENVTEQGLQPQNIVTEQGQSTSVDNTLIPQLPVNKKGEIEYDQITEPDMYAQGLTQEFGEDAPAIVDELIAEQNEALKKAKKASSAIERARKVKAINTELAKLAQVRDIINPQTEVKEEPGYDSENIQGLPGEVGGRQELEQAQPDEETGRGEIETGGIFQEQGEEKITDKIVPNLKKPTHDSPEAQLIKAETEVDTRPTEAQKEAGNYKKGHISIEGMEISIENPAGSIRKGKDKTGKEWSVMLNNSYGYFRRSKGKDGDQIDVFLGDNLTPESVYIIDQVDPETGQFDEHKVMLGFDSAQSARENYLANYEPGWKGLGAITKMSIADFKKWLGDGTRTRKPVAPELIKEETFPKSRLSPIDKMLNMTGQEIVNEWEELVYPIDLLSEQNKKQALELQKQKKATRKKDERAKFDEKIKQLQNETHKAYDDLENEYGERNEQLWQWIKSEIKRRGISIPEETEDEDYYFFSELMNDIFERPGRDVTWYMKFKDVFDEQFNGWVENKIFASLKPKAEEKAKPEEAIEPKAEQAPAAPETRDLTGFRKGDLVKNVQTEMIYEIIAPAKDGKVHLKVKGGKEIIKFSAKRKLFVPVQKEIKVKGKKRGPITFKPDSPYGRALNKTPESFEEAVMQFFIGGGRVRTDDFRRYLGIDPIKEKYLWAIKNDGTHFDVLHETMPNSFGIEEQGSMAEINAIGDVLRNYHTKNEMVEELLRRMDQPLEQELAPEDVIEQMEDATEENVEDTAPETVDNLLAQILASKETMSIFTSGRYFDGNGNIDWAKLKDLAEKDPDHFTFFPFSLNETEFENFKALLNDTERQRELSRKVEGSYPIESRGEGDILRPGTPGDEERDEGRNGTEETGEGETEGPEGITIPGSDTGDLRKSIVAYFGDENIDYTKSPISLREISLKDGRTFVWNNEKAWTNNEGPAVYVETTQAKVDGIKYAKRPDGTLKTKSEYTPEEWSEYTKSVIDKKVSELPDPTDEIIERYAGSGLNEKEAIIVDTAYQMETEQNKFPTGQRTADIKQVAPKLLSQGLIHKPTLDNTGVIRLTDKGIELAKKYQKKKEAPKDDIDKLNDLFAEKPEKPGEEQARDIVREANTDGAPEKLLKGLTLPNEVVGFFKSLKKSESSRYMWSVYGKGFRPYNANKIREFFSHVHNRLNRSDAEVLKTLGFNTDLVEKTTADSITFKNGVYLNLSTGEYQGNRNHFFAGTQVSFQGYVEKQLMSLVDKGKLTLEQAQEIENETPNRIETGATGTYKDVQSYINSIRNPDKKKFAEDYNKWVQDGRPEGKEPVYGGKSAIAQQAVRWDINKFYENQEKQQPEARQYQYKMSLRPFDIGTYPKEGFIKAEDDPKGGFQILTYDRKLSEKERNHWSFLPLTEVDELKDKQFEDPDGEYFVDLEWMPNYSGADVSMFDSKNQLVEKPYFMSTNEILKNIESGYWKEKKEVEKANVKQKEQVSAPEFQIINTSSAWNDALKRGVFAVLVPKGTRFSEIDEKKVLGIGGTSANSLNQLSRKAKELGLPLDEYLIYQVVDGNTSDAYAYTYSIDGTSFTREGSVSKKDSRVEAEKPKEEKKGPQNIIIQSPEERHTDTEDNEETSQAPEQKKTEFAGEYLEKKPEEKVLKEEKPKGPDYKTPKGQAELLKYLIDAENNLASNQKEIASLKDSESLSPVKRKELKQRELLQEQNQKRINDLKEQIDNDILPPEKQNEIRKLIQETNTRNAVVANRILRLQDERDTKEKSLQKRNTLLGDSKIEQEKQAGMQDLFGMEEVFQPKAENLQAALKPFNDGIKKAEEEIDRNNQLLDEKIDLVLKGTQEAIDWGIPPAEADEKAEAPKEENPDELKLEIVEVSKPSQKIEDFGEHISGAKKEIRGQLKKHLETTDEDLLNNSISKVLPPVDYKNLVDSGMATPQESAFLAYLRMGIGPKPKSQYKQAGWLRKVNAYKDALRWIIEKEEFMAAHEGQSMMELLEKSADVYLVKRMKDYISTLVELGFPNDVTSLKDYEIKHFEGGVRIDGRGGKIERPARWTIVKGHYIVQDFETREQAIAGLKYILTTENEAPRKVKFDVWKENGKKGLFVGKKVGPGKYITLASGFDKISEVRKYIENHQEELEKMLEQKKIIPYERPEERGPRIGKDYRKGENVTPELFSQTFGFRGVQFGNYVEQLKRQEDLNEAYDALMDLSEILGLPPMALSLSGQLGIAFGARGTGGKQAPSAHYEPDEIVINLTKSAGAGSLAHEWFHAVDNYFSRSRGEKFGYLIERPFQLINKDGTKSDLIRPEVIEAFKNVVNTIHGSGLRQRSKELDKRRTKDYWSQPIEMAARSFEAYIKAKLSEREVKNDYLVSFKDIVDYIIAAGGEEGVYPYPTKEESEKIFGAFDNLFSAIQTKEEDGRVVMYRISRAGGTANNKPFQEFSDRDAIRAEKAAVKEFGTTDDWREVGYITFNGNKLDFSGKNDGGMPGERGYDHRQVNSALDGIDLGKYETDKYWQDSASNGMYAFLDMGNIRVSSSFGGLAMTMMPTTEQFREIRNFIRHYNGMISLDLNDTGVEYNKWTDEEQIINDIKRFYDEGIVPLPDFSAFRSTQPQGEALLESVIGGETPNYDRYLTDKITELGESFNTPITVVRNKYELPVRLQRQMQRYKVWNSRVTGLYDRQTGTIYVLLDDIKALGADKAMEEVTKTVLHEIVAHKGLPELLGEEEYKRFLDDLYWDIPQDDRALLMYEYSTDDKKTIAEEYLGMMAEDNINPNLFQRVLAKIRQLLRRLFRVSYSENDIRDMLRRSQENLRRPQTKDYEFAGEYLEDSVKEERSGSFRARQRVKQSLLEQAAEAYSEKEKKRQLGETMQGIREYFQDLNLPIRRFEEEVIKRGGQQDKESKPYRDLNLSFGRHEKLYNDFFDEKMKPVLDAIAQLKKAGVPGENILPYIICKHAIERNAVMRGHELREWTDSNKNATFEDIEAQKEALKDKDYSGVMGFDKDGSYTNPDELARDIVKEFESQVQNKKLIDNLWSTTKAATNTILDAWEDGLQISPERKKEYQEQYRFFVPLRGWREGAAKDLVYTKGEGFSKSLRHAEGRKSLADNPLAYIQQVAFQAIAEQIDNEVKTSMSNLIIRNLKNNEIHELATIKKLYYVKVHLPDGTHEWEPTTDRPSPELFESGEATQKIYRAHERLRAPRQAKEHEVYVHRPGGDLVMIFKGKNLPVAQALNKQNYIYRSVFGHYDARDINKAFMLMGHINNMLKAAYTSWNVVFPFTNFMRDFQEASITQAIKQGTGLKVIRNYKHAFPAIARHIAGRSDLKKPIDRELDDFYRLGGATGYTHLKTPEEIEKDINNEIKRMVREGTLRGDMQNSAITFLNAVEAWNRIFEDATRFAVYRASLAAGNTKEDAAIDAKEASVNFNRKGKGSKAWDAWFAFFNVALQSMQKNFSLAKHHTGRFSAVALSFITVGFIEAMMNALFDDAVCTDDDSSYYNINPYMRHNYLVIPNVISLIKGEGKGDKYLSIPLPQFWRGFKSMGAIGFDIATKRTKVIDGIMDALGNFGSSLLPVDIGGFWKSGEFSFAPIMPTVIKPIVEVAENKNYMGYAIMNEPFTRDQKKILANAGLGKKNVSPAAKFFTDMLFRWGGGDTKYKYYYDEAKGRHRKVPGVLDINPSAIEHLFKGYTGGTGAVFSDMITTISQAFDPEEEIDFRNTPFVNRFIRKTPEAKWNIIKEYYDLRDDSKVTNLLSKEYWKSGSYDKAMSILGDEYSMKYIQIIKHYESALDDAAKAMDYDTVEGSDLTIELMRQCIIDIRDLKEEHGKK